MKALEKAAQDRKGSNAAPASADAEGDGVSKPELTIEPALTPQRRTAAAPSTTRDAQQASTIIRAGRRDSGGLSALLDRPVWVVGTLGALFAIGYGVYVYLQISNPGLFLKHSPPLARAPAAAAGNVTVAAAPPSAAALPLLPLQENSTAAETPAASTAPAAASSAAPTPLPEAPPAPPAPRDTIKIKIGSAPPALNPLTTDAYQALQAGNLDTAQQNYAQLLKDDPTNLDALLGLAVIAAKHGDNETAARHYMRVLELDPRNAAAQAGLLSLFGGADLLAAETRLKQLISQNPSPFLYFALGNVYADQQRWPDAQQAYFQAQRLQPDNPDYAYNLAVGLDHIGQSKLALEFYRRAVRLAATKGQVNFSTSAAEDRVNKLQKTVE